MTNFLAASRSRDSWSWHPQTVHFSQGTPATAQGSGPMNVVSFIVYGENQSLVVTLDQLLAPRDGKLKRANRDSAYRRAHPDLKRSSGTAG